MKKIRETGIESVISKKLSMPILYALMLFIVLISIGPFIILIVNGTRTDAQIASSATLIPGTNALENYRVMQEFINFPRHIVNSLFIAATGAILACYFGALAGYALAKLNFRGRNIVFIIVLVSIMMPWQLGIIGFYTMIVKAGFVDSYLPIILPAIGTPLVIFFLKQYIGSHIPDELIEAARIEGVSELRLFNMIILPLSIPALMTMGILSFVNLWNSYLLPLMIIRTTDKFPIQVALGLLSSSTEKHMGALYLGLALSVMIVAIIYISQARRILENVGSGAVKG